MKKMEGSIKDLVKRTITEGEWKPLRFAVYNHLEEKERYQQGLEELGYNSEYDNLECKSIIISNVDALCVKDIVEGVFQRHKVVVAVCIFKGQDALTFVKPKEVDAIAALSLG